MAGGDIEIRIVIDRRIDGQESRQGLADHPDAAALRREIASDRLGRRDMHDIERHVEALGHGDGPQGRFALALRRAGQGMALGAGDAFGQEFGLELGD